jgi:hypothetical protein
VAGINCQIPSCPHRAHGHGVETAFEH